MQQQHTEYRECLLPTLSQDLPNESMNMNDTYQPDAPASVVDMMIVDGSGPEPEFDSIMQTFLQENYADLKRRCQETPGLLEYASLGHTHPWLYRLTFATRGLIRVGDGEVESSNRHVVALRFLPDYIRRADRFAMLRLMEPVHAFHPNINAGAICVQIHDGEPLVEICQSLHELFRWRLRQYDERDALNAAACAWGRQNIDQPIDDRPLFGKRLQLNWQTTASTEGSTP